MNGTYISDQAQVIFMQMFNAEKEIFIRWMAIIIRTVSDSTQ